VGKPSKMATSGTPGQRLNSKPPQKGSSFSSSKGAAPNKDGNAGRGYQLDAAASGLKVDSRPPAASSGMGMHGTLGGSGANFSFGIKKAPQRKGQGSSAQSGDYSHQASLLSPQSPLSPAMTDR